MKENNRMGKTRDIFKKTDDSKGAFQARQGRKGKAYPTKCTVPENSKERQEGLSK